MEHNTKCKMCVLHASRDENELNSIQQIHAKRQISPFQYSVGPAQNHDRPLEIHLLFISDLTDK